MFKKIILASAFALSFCGASELEFSRELSEDIVAKEFQSRIYIDGANKSMERLKEGYDSFLKYLKDKGSVCEGGEYAITPNYNYDNNKREFGGYNGRLELFCKFADVERFDEVLELVDAVLDKDTFKISMMPIKAYISEAQLSSSIKRLERKMINEGRGYLEDLNATLDLNCKIKSLKLQTQDGFIPLYRSEMGIDMMKSSSTQTPIEPKKNIRIRGDFTLYCEE